jgi:hypothetical protein
MLAPDLKRAKNKQLPQPLVWGRLQVTGGAFQRLRIPARATPSLSLYFAKLVHRIVSKQHYPWNCRCLAMVRQAHPAILISVFAQRWG